MTGGAANGGPGRGGCGSEACGCGGASRALPTLSEGVRRGLSDGGRTEGSDGVRRGLSDGVRPTEQAPSGTSRRDFLKVLGITGAGAATFGCGPPDVGGDLLPYLVQQEDIVPSHALTFATVLPDAGPEPLAVHARVLDGRVIKLDGNPAFPNRGRLSALGQSALQDLYDPDRVQGPLRASRELEEGEREDPERDPGERFEEAGWEDAIAAAGRALAEGPAVLLTEPLTGTAARFVEAWAEATGAEWIPFHPFDEAAARAAHEIAFGQAQAPMYALEEADRVVSFGADFLGTWLAPVALAARFQRAREVEAGRYAKLTYVAPRRSLTGANADEWIPARAGTEAAVALAVANVVAERRGTAGGRREGYTPEAVAELAGIPAEAIRRLGEELAAAESPVALPPGPEARGTAAAEAHLAVALLNQALGAYGRTVRLGEGPVRGRSASFAEIEALIERMRAGEVRTLIVAGANPAFRLPGAAGFVEALGRVPTVIAVSTHLDDTAALADWVLPSHHALESWGDAEIAPGVRALGQPVMTPIFDTRPREEILAAIGGAAGATGPAVELGEEGFAGYLREAWREEHGRVGGGTAFDDWWRERLRRGGLPPAGAGENGAEAAARTARNGRAGGAEPEGAGGGPAGPGQTAGAPQAPPTLRTEARDFAFGPAAAPGGTALVAYPSVQFYDGRGANRSWMQELPDPVTRLVWSSWVEVHPETAEALGVGHGDVVEVRSEAGSLEAPVYVFPGIRPDTVAIPIGQGHRAYGRYARGRGVNPLDILPARSDERSGGLALAGVSVELHPTGRRQRLVSAQGSDTDQDRHVAEVSELDEALEAIRAHEPEPDLHPAAWDSDAKSPYRWGMTIDLNACIGCGACVTACYAENNVPVVGEERFARGREMSWLRVSRYWKDTEDGGQVTVHQPTLCQHCGDAPCEPVCPVYAAYHTAEGLNAQVYNRCVGTRYCSNNCPYKVRRFNWFTYEFPYPLNLQLNPNVTVREKGVMEKCTFCVQRIQRAKLDAKEEGRFVLDGEVTTACQDTCPTNAIVFGNLKDPESRVSRAAKSARGYGLLGELGTRPAVIYLQDVKEAALVHADHPPAGPARPYRDVPGGTHEHNVPPAPAARGEEAGHGGGEEGGH